MNPKRLAFWRAFFVLRPPTKDRKCNNAIFLRFYAQTEKKTCFPPSRSTKTRHKRFERVAWLCTKSMHDRFRPFKRANGSKRQTFSSENGERDAEFFACREALAGCLGAQP